MPEDSEEAGGGGGALAIKMGDGRSVEPELVGGVISAYAPAFGAKGSRLFTPCGTTVQLYSVKTTKLLGTLSTAHGERVTAICAGAAAEGCVEPLATGTAHGEVRLWDGKTGECLGSLKFEAPVLGLRWPSESALLVALGEAGGQSCVERIDTSTPTAPKRESTLPLSAQRGGPFDASGSAVVLADGGVLQVWSQGWPGCRKLNHRHNLTAVSIDPLGRYVAAGDARGAVWVWWGAFEEANGDSGRQRVPARWHWHTHPVRALAHCGPLLLSGGDEGVLCIRNINDDTVQFVPRFPAPIRHLATSLDGKSVSISLEQNSLALIDGLHGWIKPKWIHALDVPVATIRTGESAARASGALRGSALHPLAGGGVATASGGRRVQFLDESGKVIPSRTLNLERSNTVKCGDPMLRWSLRQLAFSARATCLLTCEARRNPACERFDAESGGAQGCVLKWWRERDDGKFVVDSVAQDAHSGEITVALAHPSREHSFVTASLDGTFKSWDLVVAGKQEGEEGGEEVKAPEKKGPRCFQCMAQGSWRARPMLSGCFSPDGSMLALGFHGFAVLWEYDTVTELRALHAGEATDRVVQLYSAVACERFLLVANVRGTSGTQEAVCWDLARLTVLARVDLGASLAGERRCVVRVASQAAAGPLRVLGYRSSGGELKVWRLEARDGEEGSFEEEASGSLPPGRNVLDAAFAGGAGAGGEENGGGAEGNSLGRVLCWTSEYELWGVDLSAGAPSVERRSKAAKAAKFAGASAAVAKPIEDDEPIAATSAAGRALSAGTQGKAAAAAGYQGLRFLDFPQRTTTAQQAGIVPHLVEKVCPPHVPSHMLPPPPALWDSFLAVFAKPSPAAAAQAAADVAGSTDVAGLSGKAGASAASATEAEEALGPSPASEFADAAWMDGLLKEVLAAA